MSFECLKKEMETFSSNKFTVINFSTQIDRNNRKTTWPLECWLRGQSSLLSLTLLLLLWVWFAKKDIWETIFFFFFLIFFSLWFQVKREKKSKWHERENMNMKNLIVFSTSFPRFVSMLINPILIRHVRSLADFGRWFDFSLQFLLLAWLRQQCPSHIPDQHLHTNTSCGCILWWWSSFFPLLVVLLLSFFLKLVSPRCSWSEGAKLS